MTSPLDRYQIVGKLGEGGCGVTFLAEHLGSPNKRLRAVKQLRPSEANSHALKYIKESFEREARHLELLGDECGQVPKFYDFFEADGQLYIVQEYVEGKTLSALASEGVLGEQSARDILLSALDALRCVHSFNVLHRDINPKNIILRERDGSAVLIDFGVVKELATASVDSDGRIKTTYVVGASGFISPQQVLGEHSYSNDLYSLGMSVIYALTVIHPDRMESDLQTGKKLWQKYARGVSDEFVALLDRAVDRSAERRFQTAGEMKAAVELLPARTGGSREESRTQDSDELITTVADAEVTAVSSDDAPPDEHA